MTAALGGSSSLLCGPKTITSRWTDIRGSGQVPVTRSATSSSGSVQGPAIGTSFWLGAVPTPCTCPAIGGARPSSSRCQLVQGLGDGAREARGVVEHHGVPRTGNDVDGDACGADRWIVAEPA